MGTVGARPRGAHSGACFQIPLEARGERLSGHHFLLSIELAPVTGGTEVRWTQTFDTVEHYQNIAAFVATANQQNLA
ncbi:protein of unknown function [Magnetospirillum sp. XM-1]|nr:protein of unknown function [Magnetospirillum sp. XM-1]